MDEKILVDAIVDRIVTNAHATVLHCDDSMRKHFTQIDYARSGRAQHRRPPRPRHGSIGNAGVAQPTTEQWLTRRRNIGSRRP